MSQTKMITLFQVAMTIVMAVSKEEIYIYGRKVTEEDYLSDCPV